MDFRKLKSASLVGFLVFGVSILGVTSGSASGTLKAEGVDKALTESVEEDLFKNQITLNSSQEDVEKDYKIVKSDVLEKLEKEYEDARVLKEREVRENHAREVEKKRKEEELRKKKIEEARKIREAEKKAEEKADRERIERERLEFERKEALRKEAERKEELRKEADRREAERREAERKEQATESAVSASSQEDLAHGTKKYYMEATAYTATCKGCSGITAMGIDVRNSTTYQGYGIIAVDTRVIPLGTKVSINGRKYIAGDTGGAIKGNKIDVLVGSVDEALQFGRKHGLEVIVLGK